MRVFHSFCFVLVIHWVSSKSAGAVRISFQSSSPLADYYVLIYIFVSTPSLTVIRSPELKIIDHLRTSAPVDPKAPNFHSVTNLSEGSLFGELEPKDTEWLCAGGFVTETQTFYTVTEDGQFLNCQVIHSSVG